MSRHSSLDYPSERLCSQSLKSGTYFDDHEMEFPHIGKHCSEPTCHKLDFLPIKCDACHEIFCHDHMTYNGHNCVQGKSRDHQVPVCPLCNQPVPSKRSEPPDLAVGAHIDRDCDSDHAKSRRKVFTNKCFVKGCKRKEIIPITCRDCKRNFCLTHRHPSDHSCNKKLQAEAKPLNKRIPQPAPRGNSVPDSYYQQANKVQGNMTEDEALARAIAVSLQENDNRQRAAVGASGVGNHSSQSNCIVS